MSEKRFGETERNCYYTSLVFDNQTQEELGTDKVVVLLNEQQNTIQELEDENEKLKKEIRRLMCLNNQLERRLDYSIAYDMEECE